MKTICNVKRIVTVAGIALLFVLTVGGLAAAQVCVAPPPDMVSWWPGDGNAMDIKDGNPGTLFNGATFAPGMVAQAFSFDGMNDVVRIPDASNLHFTNQVTVEAWINKKGSSQHPWGDGGRIVDKLTAGWADGWLFDNHPGTGKLRFAIGQAEVMSNAILPLNTWTHVAGVYDGSTLSVYINGVLEGTTSTNVSIPTNSLPLRIGADSTEFVEVFNGLIDEVAIYSRSLSADEIAAIFNAGSAGKCTITLDLIPPEYSFCGSVSINGYVGELDGIITRLSWDWNDGTVADSWFPAAHRYRENGAYTVTVTAFSSTGETKSNSTSVSITNADDALCNYGVMTDLGTLGGNHSAAYSINGMGQVVGVSMTPTGEYHAFLWQNGVMTDLGTLGGNWSQATGINTRGQVVGISTISTGEEHAFLWQDGVMTDLGSLVGDYYGDNYFARAYGINVRGQVVGVSTSFTANHAFLWQNGVMTDLGALRGDSIALGINGSGQVVGLSMTPTRKEHAVLWKNGLITDLGTLGGNYSAAFGINGRGHVVGQSTTSTGAYHAFLWKNGVMMDLGTLGDYFSVAFGITDTGQVVGATGLQAFLWKNGVMMDLGTLGGNYSAAYGINGMGKVVGVSMTPTGEYHAFIWRK